MTWLNEVDRFISTSVDESRVLEFKREVDLHDRSAKIETLKDLTGMANGGGGLVVFGIDEITHADGRATSAGARAISDRSVPGQLMDIIRDTVFPPLLVDFHEVDVKGGYVLVAELFASPLGPYMVEGFGQSRFFTRSGRSTMPMSEQQVRDRYSLALRTREQRKEVWELHGMPMKPAHGPWLGVSIVPEEPLVRRLVTGKVTPSELVIPERLRSVITDSGVVHVHERLGRWANGLFGFDGTRPEDASAAIRIHSDGALACGHVLPEVVTADSVARSLNGMLVYLGWIADFMSLRNPLEIAVRIDHVSQVVLETREANGSSSRIPPNQPLGLAVMDLELREELRPRSLSAAPFRHRIVRELIDRLTSAFGGQDKTVPFERGPLYDLDGNPLGIVVAGDRFYSERRYDDIILYSDGSVRVLHNSQLVGFLRDGALVDEAGAAVAVTELATGIGCPDDFSRVANGDEAWRHVPSKLGMPSEPYSVVSPAEPTRRWSSIQFGELLERARSTPI